MEEIVLVKINEVKSNPNNPRLIKDEKFKQLVKSIQDFPDMLKLRPIVVNDDMVVLGGNMRLKACKEAGLKDIPIIKASSLTEQQQKEFIIKDNVGYGEWEWDTLANEWDAEQLTEWGLDIPNFEAEVLEAEDDDFAVPDGGIETDIVLGDLFEIGEHRLLCGDSTDSDNVTKLMNGQKADILFTSPPYGAGNVAKLRNKYKRGADKLESFYGEHKDNPKEWGELMSGWTNAFLPFVDSVFCNVQMLADNKIQMLEWLFNYKDIFCDVIIWDKNHGAPQMQDKVLNNAFEFIFVLGGNGSRSIPFSNFHGTISNIVRIDPKGKNDFANVHKATMPISLPNFIISELCNDSKSVADCFLGTGTTMVAAHQLKRKCYGMELDPKYCQVIVDRMLKLDSTLTIKRNGEIWQKKI
jgi:DNA modification methylase